ncbi:MAG: type II toxin-antitoxin system death-on-curing family toxin [Firmicutes bacterium]|nr:type II toxin-antitoxin system death-on-curing family toxin [[Eubacterium] siraeum]MCM1487281.1 type II toxin-antitoxin system death-on-curing family toxin [Bacillota bacterium]
MIRLTEQQVISVHEMMIKATGGSSGVRDIGLLCSALNAPFQSFEGKEMYPSLLSKAAALCRSIISNHPFVDGNKRIGIHVMLIFLELNGIQSEYTQKELIDLGLGVASGDFNVNDILNWLTEHCK